MAAYAALVSLMHIIEQIQHHPRPPISLDIKQAEFLIEKIAFLHDFLEVYSHVDNEEADGLQSRIADAAHAAEDIIESHVVDQILAQSTSTTHGENMNSSIDLYQSLQKVIEDMDFIKKEVMEIQEKREFQDQLQVNPTPASGSLRPLNMGPNTIVGFDDILIQLMDKLTRQQANRIIPIVGMGGIGKTTLARSIYEKSLIVQYFDVRAWITISQEYNVQEILLELLCQISEKNRETLSEKSEKDLSIQLHKTLSGRRYLIIIDDIWSIEAWDKIQFFFPDNNNGSRIMITTRVSNVALYISGTSGLEMDFLDEDKSWNLLCKHVFGEDYCPLELEKIGRRIAKSCKGLPLSIVVIGGLLAKSKWTQEYWENIAENLNSIVNLNDNKHCLKILYTSYSQLPIHLKPCFLYMGIFPEDSEIHVARIIKLWVAEGFLKPISGKSSEKVAEEYLKNLIDRNLILVYKWRPGGEIKSCKIHDLLRDLCLREAQKDKFVFVTRLYGREISRDIRTQRHIVIHGSMSKKKRSFPLVLYTLDSRSLARSLIRDSLGVLESLNFNLLRVLKTADNEYSLEAILQLVNSRNLEVGPYLEWTRFPSSIYHLWNLQTLVLENSINDTINAPSEIWKMSQLRHVEVKYIHLPDPPCSDGQDEDFVLANLQTLLEMVDFKCGEEVVKRIPNLKKLKIWYDNFGEGWSWSRYCVKNLGRLHKLESLSCFFISNLVISQSDLLHNLCFPHSLKKLSLFGCKLHWEDITTKIGSLPLLQVLKLRTGSFIGPKWETVEEQFGNLKFLLIQYCDDLEYWITDITHFPRLEYLVLRGLDKLKEIPPGIGEIPTLKLIELDDCSDSSMISAKEIIEEQEELGNEDLKVRVRIWEKNQVVERLASHNFLVKVARWAA